MASLAWIGRHDPRIAIAYAIRAAAQGDKLMAQAFSVLVAMLQQPGAPALETELTGIRKKLTALEHSQMNVDQIETARAEFGLRHAP